MKTMTEEARSPAEWAEMRGRHHHGDDQIRALWRQARKFADELWVVPNGGHGPLFGEQAAPFVSTATAFLGK